MSLFNSFPHTSLFHLAVFPSPLLWSGTLSGAHDRGARELTVNNPGTLPVGLLPGYTLEADSDAGTSRPSVQLRLRGYATNGLHVSENAVKWEDGQALRLYKEMRPWSVKPRIVVANDTPVFYKDYDIAYTNQNQIVKPVVNMGPHYAGPVGSRVYYSAQDSFCPQENDSIAAVSWTFEGGTPSSYSGTTPGYVTYVAEGTYITQCTITTALGASATGYRFIYIGSEVRDDWGMDSLEGDIGNGYVLKGWSRTTYEGKLHAGALVIVYGEERFGGVLYTATERPYRSETIFVGYVRQRSVKWNARLARWDFEAVSVSIYADLLDVYDTSLQFRETTQNWFWWKYWRLTLDKGIICHLMWHTNILSIADYFRIGDSTPVKYIDIGRGGPFTSIRQLLHSSMPGWITCNTQGSIYCSRDPNLMEVEDRPATSWMTIGPEQYREEPYVVDADPFETSHMGAGGFAFSGATGTNIAYLSAAPMEAADDYGKPQDVQGLILTPAGGQDELNNICGHLYARANNQFADTNWPLVGNFRPFLDIAPVRRVLINVPEDPLGWVDEVFYVHKISHKHDAGTGVLLTDLNASRQTVGLPGVTIEIPIPESDPPPPPPILPPPIIPPPPPGEPLVGVVMYVQSAGGGTQKHLVYSGDLNLLSQPTYTFMDLPDDFTGPPTVSDLFAHTVQVTRDGSRLFLAGIRSDLKGVIWECTNWNSIWNSPTPPDAIWAERVVYGVTTVPGGTINVVSTLTAGNLSFNASNIAYFTCRINTTYALGQIALDGTVTASAVTTVDSSSGIGPEVYNDISLTSGNSYLRDYTGTSLFTFNDSKFGTRDNSSPYRNLLGGPAVTGYVRDTTPEKTSIRHSSGYFDLTTYTGSEHVIFDGNPHGLVVYASVVTLNQAWVSTDGGYTWNTFATWLSGRLKPITLDGDVGCLWVAQTVVNNGSVPLRYYDTDGSVISDLTGNWWTELFTTRTSTEIIGSGGWYGT